MLSKQTVIDRLDIKAYYYAELSKLKPNGGSRAMALCPFHEDKTPSLSVHLDTGDFHCFGCEEKGSIFDFYMKRHSVDFKNALNALATEAGIDTQADKPRIVAVYDYKDEDGNLLYQTVRYEPKDFRQRRPDGKGGYEWNLKGVRLVPYRLPKVLQAKSIVIVEGEKDADTLNTWELTATCNAMGAEKWKPEYNQYFKGKRVAIIPDNDDAGMNHAQDVARNLKGIVESVKVVELPGLPDKGDVSDWIKQGGTKGALIDHIKQTQEWEPSVVPVSIPEDKDRGTTGNSMVLTRLADLFSEPDEVISWQWEGILPVGGFSVVASKPKTGKSTIARNLALCTARGETFFEQGVNQGAVIYYALEEKKAEVKRHFRDMGAQGDEPIYIYAGGASLDALREVYEAVKTIKPVLIIIDPLFRLAKVKDGNDYIQVTEALDPLLRLARETGSHVLCVHHTGKGERAGGDSVLGSTAIFSSVDTLLIMKRHERYRTIQSIQRYGTDLEETTLHFDMDSRTLSIGKSREEEDIGSMKDAIGDFLSNREEPATEPEIMADVEGRTGLKRKALRELVKDGTVDRQGKGGKGDPFKYSCSLVPIYIREQENENPKNDVTPCNNEENACSQVLGDSGGNDESRERAFSGSEGLEDGDPGEVIELAEEDVEIIE